MEATYRFESLTTSTRSFDDGHLTSAGIWNHDLSFLHLTSGPPKQLADVTTSAASTLLYKTLRLHCFRSGAVKPPAGTAKHRQQSPSISHHQPYAFFPSPRRNELESVFSPFSSRRMLSEMAATSAADPGAEPQSVGYSRVAELEGVLKGFQEEQSSLLHAESQAKEEGQRASSGTARQVNGRGCDLGQAKNDR